MSFLIIIITMNIEKLKVFEIINLIELEIDCAIIHLIYTCNVYNLYIFNN